tara:strand:- start:3848 stop:4750 length:903 start_codon:yes stop_codon:yes gene_type:complete
MAFLDNSGDIILDAVLTDTGRMRLAKGDGSFNIVKFALGDDEINYELYDKNHTSGSAYYDVEILQTPVLEAFTNNASSMKSKLMTISRTNLLYLPVMLRNTTAGLGNANTINVLSVVVDAATSGDTGDNDIINYLGAGQYIDGYTLTNNTTPVVIDQGIQSTDIGPAASQTIDPDLKETQFIIEMDNRLGILIDQNGTDATPSFIDDDNIASYYLTDTTNTTFFDAPNFSTEQIKGPQGNRLKFLVRPTGDLQASTYLFTQIGSTDTYTDAVYIIDTTIRISGATTGYYVDIPIRYIKKQ